MGFLKKFGSVAAQVLAAAAGFAPMVKQFTPDSVDARIDAGMNVFGKVVDAAKASEVAGQAWGQPGPERAKLAAALSAEAFLKWVATSGHEISDQAKFQAAAVTISGGVADLLSSLQAKD